MATLKYWDGSAWQTLPALKGDTGPAGLAPVGAVISWSGKTTPVGWLLANGTATYTEALYPEAYAFAVAEVAAGNTLWTANTGAHTFGVPDLRDRFVFAAGTKAFGLKSQTNPALANPGEETHTLLSTEMPIHSHPAASPGAFVLSALGQINHNSVNNSPAVTGAIGSGSASDTSGANTATTGSGGAHNNMPPYVVLSLIVKVA